MPTDTQCAGLAPCTDLATGDPTCQDQSGAAPVSTLGTLALGGLVLLLIAGGLLMLRRRQRWQPV